MKTWHHSDWFDLLKTAANIATAIAAWFAYRLAWKRWGQDRKENYSRRQSSRIRSALKSMGNEVNNPKHVAEHFAGELSSDAFGILLDEYMNALESMHDDKPFIALRTRELGQLLNRRSGR